MEKLVFTLGKNYIGEQTQFAERLATIRKKRNRTCKAISEYLDLDKSTYGTYERDEYLPNAKVIYKLAKYYGVSADYLLCLTDDEKPSTRKIYQDFSPESAGDFITIAEDIRNKTTFESMIHSKSFIKLIEYIYVYLTFSAKLPRKARGIIPEDVIDRELRMFNPYRREKQPSDETGIPYGYYPGDNIYIKDLYYGVIHKELDKILKELSSNEFFVSEFFKQFLILYNQQVDKQHIEPTDKYIEELLFGKKEDEKKKESTKIEDEFQALYKEWFPDEVVNSGEME